jgi:hypothetical protein
LDVLTDKSPKAIDGLVQPWLHEAIWQPWLAYDMFYVGQLERFGLHVGQIKRRHKCRSQHRRSFARGVEVYIHVGSWGESKGWPLLPKARQGKKLAKVAVGWRRVVFHWAQTLELPLGAYGRRGFWWIETLIETRHPVQVGALYRRKGWGGRPQPEKGSFSSRSARHNALGAKWLAQELYLSDVIRNRRTRRSGGVRLRGIGMRVGLVAGGLLGTCLPFGLPLATQVEVVWEN